MLAPKKRYYKHERERLHELFEVRGGKLFNKVDRGRAKAGEEAGSLSGCGYLYVKYDGGQERVHRIIYAMHYGRTIKDLVDHIDGNRLNNDPSNLRDVDHATNMNNLPCHR